MWFEPQKVRIRFGRPAGTGELQVRDEVAAGANERLQQAELGGRELEWRAVDARVMPPRIKRQSPCLNRARRRGTSPIHSAHDRRDAGKQLGLAERLDQIVVRA